ncbi:MAG: hypothetical protein HUU25_05235 [Candidatus Sumerlaeia bacterium]|nr:hypothetical protein [Candidatus Sumerlaeia bacterium]
MLMTRTRRWGALFASGLLALTGVGGARATMLIGGEPTLERLVRSSVAICQGEVIASESRFVNRRIETTYTIRADRYLRGTGDETFEMTVFGGAVEEPLPLAMVFDRMVVLSPGQDVILFLEGPPNTPEAQALAAQALDAGAELTPAATSLRPVLGEIGVFTILTDPSTGSRHVTQLRYSARGAILTPDVNSRVLQEAERRLSLRDIEPSLGRSDKIELLDLARPLSEALRRPPGLSAVTADGSLVPIPQPTAEPPPAASASPGAAPEDAHATLSHLRTLDDFAAEINDLVAEEGR